jgi:hypothetical protein
LKKKTVFLFIYFLIFVSGSSLQARDICPYCINGYVSLVPESGEFKYAGMYITFYNRTDKNINLITFTFFLYDKDGNPPFFENNCITVDYVQEVRARDTLDFCIGLDEYVASVPDEPYQIDYLYAAKIEYEDGTV